MSIDLGNGDLIISNTKPVPSREEFDSLEEKINLLTAELDEKDKIIKDLKDELMKAKFDSINSNDVADGECGFNL